MPGSDGEVEAAQGLGRSRRSGRGPRSGLRRSYGVRHSTAYGRGTLYVCQAIRGRAQTESSRPLCGGQATDLGPARTAWARWARSRALARRRSPRWRSRIADAEGLDAVSIRRIARELGSGAMSLYHYFDSRDELLDLMSDSRRGGDGRARAARRTGGPALIGDRAPEPRDTFRRHPWLPPRRCGRARASRPNLLRHIEQSSQAVAGLAADGVDPALLSAIVVAVDDYTIGFTLRECRGHVDEHGATARRASRTRCKEPYVRALLESGEFPLLSRSSSAMTASSRSEDRFEHGLDWLLDGFAAQIG